MARPPAKATGKKDSAPKIVTLTKRRCAHCGHPIPSDSVYTVLSISAEGNRRFVHYTKGHYTA